ncbi:MAG: amidohydrolase [Alphaproteobacteria bacterium]|nr:amidohydrolase [Alphaproteobacteria bacterium]
MTQKSRRRRTKAAEIRGRLTHPVIDSDGHVIEFVPAIIDYVKKFGGGTLADRYVAFLKRGPAHSFNIGGDRSASGWHKITPAERREKRVVRPSFWLFPAANTRDRATAMLPRLLRERLDDIGIDFLILYPTLGIHLLRHPDSDLRRLGCRAINALHADIFREHADRMTPAAIIPMHTPAEALDELEFAITGLGLKVALIAGGVSRPVAEVAARAPDLARHGLWVDNLALDSAYDYDPVWAKCVELKVAATAHSGSMGWGPRTSPSNFIYNHIGHFAAAGEAFCKALVLGGVTQRFPALNFAFLEGGAAWGVDLYNRLIEHWRKRGRRAMEERIDPARLDGRALADLFRRYGGALADGRLDAVGQNAGNPYEPTEDRAEIDDWSHLRIERAEDLYDLFVPRFFFGCEGDDRMTAVAFNRHLNLTGARINAIFGSDIGHFDVADIAAVLEEAYEMVEDELLTEANFRDFVFANPIALHAGMNPAFFEGTIVEQAVATHAAPRPAPFRQRDGTKTS